MMGMCNGCVYYWKEDGESFAQCQYHDERFPTPCEYEEMEGYMGNFDEWDP